MKKGNLLLNPHLLTAYSRRFLGYGCPEGDFWFIGLEERGNSQVDEARRRLAAWKAGGAGVTEDLAAFHLRARIDTHFVDPCPLQPTWSKLIHCYLVARGRASSTTVRRKFQAHELGRREGDTCLLELWPLPSPGIGCWLYPKWSRLEWLESRSAYETHLRDRRVAQLRSTIKRYRPRVVLFYGLTANEHWREIAGCALEPVLDGSAFIGAVNGTTYCVARHPADYKGTLEYFGKIGRRLRRAILA